MREIYLDHAAATYTDARVLEAMQPYWHEEYGNPSSIYSLGRRAREALDKAKMTVARILNCRLDELVFTGGGTEAINLASFGAARFYQDRGRHLITSKIEHHAVLHSLKQLEKEGFEVTYLDVDEYGLVDPDAVKNALRPDTIFVAIMYANNEIGAIEPIEEIGKVIKEYRREKEKLETGNSKFEIPGTPPFFLVDACQAAGALDLDVQKLGVDLLVMDGSKIYGPKGVGCLFIRRGVRIQPLIYGGGQENNLRSGTENVPGIVGFAKALEIAHEEKEKENARLVKLRDYLIRRIVREIPKVILNGHPTRRLPNNINVSILDIEGEAMLLYLDEKGICCSTGSACASTTLDPSHVILAIGRPYEYAHGSIRFSLGRKTTKEDLDYVMKVFPGVVEKLRQISPVRLEMDQTAISHPEAFAGQGAKVKVGGKSYK